MKSLITKPEPFVVANWKMNLDISESEELIVSLREGLKDFRGKCEIVACPSFCALERMHQLLIASKIFLGAQNVFWEEKGAYTGETSIRMLKEVGCRFVIIGHSERRKYVHEDDEMIDRKMVTVVKNQLTPILCVGETSEQRRQNVQDLLITDQVKKALRYIQLPLVSQKIIIAYEPVWSIYPGQPCEPDQAKEIALVIKQALIDLYPLKIVENFFRIIYGGSVTFANVNDYVDGEIIQGVLIGNASLEADNFIKIIKKVVKNVKK